ncbi:MAG: recombinase family protein [Acidobacteria bacterium]|nr:recombinase family protein [Acidobacteriota bacterium]
MVLIWSLDRFSREGVHETLDHLRRLTDAGVAWTSYTEQYLDSVGLFRDAVLSILATLARQERVRRSERAKAAINRLKRQGRTDHLGGPVVNRDKVRQMSQDGASCREIAAAVGVSPMTVSRILKG